MSLECLPGMTRRVPGPADTVIPFLNLQTTHHLLKRPLIFIATASISDANIFNNGLYQNCFIIYRLLEAIGYLPIFIVNTKPKKLEDVPELLRNCRIAEIEEIMSRPVPVALYIEIGMSIAKNLRKYLKMLGARIVKLYLGNILNIDIETPMFFHGLNFSHHVIGEQDEIWTSPHYGMNLEYAACINQVKPEYGVTTKIAPYVWEPFILTDDGRRNPFWRKRQTGELPTLVIMEPNISFQKSSIIPILIAEEYARNHPDVPFELVVLNSERLVVSGYYKTNIEPSLTLAKQGRIKYLGRHDMIHVMKTYPHCIPVCHHINNEFNYMVLEFLHAGFPVLHNSTSWKDFGYFYPENDVTAGTHILHSAIHTHHDNIEIYKSHAKALEWRHSIYNPDVQNGWKELIQSSLTKKK